MDFTAITDPEIKLMLSGIGAGSLEDLFRDIPQEVPRVELKLPKPLSEQELLKEMEELAGLNVSTKNIDSYLGAGSYEHFIPSVVTALANRAEFVTAYTPYQAEASQGTLQSIYEYQTLICRLTGMDVSNASLYDGGTALAEAALAAYRNKEITGGQIFVSRTVHPEYRRILKTYLSNLPAELIEVPYKNGVTDINFLQDKINDKTIAVLVQSPNFFGCLEKTWEIPLLTKKYNALAVLSAYPISLGILKDPGSAGFDIAVGEGQCLGNPMSFGGPNLGYFACTKELVRRMPGRIVGRTVDTKGNAGYVLTLQTREQHIRREKATSNICSNEALNALTACIYLCALGKKGIEKLAGLNVSLSHYAYDNMCRIKDVQSVFSQPFFNEFVVKADINQDRLLSAEIIGGLSLEKFYPELKGCSLWCVTETKTKQQIDRLIGELQYANSDRQ